MEDVIRSNITGKRYKVSKVCRIINSKQAALYLKNGVELLDLYVSKDYSTNEAVVVFIFDRKESYPFYELWCKHELE